jgi:antitoxin component YwqK of YwqJK toxin-antitoxin module/peroxiredoxin
MHEHEHGMIAILRPGLLFGLACISACAGATTVTARYDNGNVASVGGHVRGLRNGPWIDYYENGRKQAEGSYDDDVQTGVWTYWFENGNKEMEGRFTDERRDGEWTSWYENGVLRAHGRFERGFEEGVWRFHADSGALDHEGMFELGRPALRWTYFNPDGSVREVGNYLRGVKVGDWIARDTTGNQSVISYPMPAGCELVEERFADAILKRAGFVRDGIPFGRWMSDHPSGALRMECTFENGEPNGRACAWREDGTLLARGPLKDGCIVGEWELRRGGPPEKLEAKDARPRPTFSGEWSPANSADQPGFVAVEAWLAELCAPRQPAPIRSASAPRVATSPPAAPIVDLAPIPARAQPWTEYETAALPALVKLYGSGKSGAAPDAEDWSAPTLRKREKKPAATAPDPGGIVGRALPVKHFTTADGSVIDLDDFVGKKNVLVTILRGFGGQVCVYCTAQTKALAEYADKFDAFDTTVVVVYPGPASGLAAFLEAYRRTFGADAKLPYKLLYDADLALTRALHIEDNMAVPTSIIVGRDGIVRWCRVAKDYADRPSARQVLDQIAVLSKR